MQPATVRGLNMSVSSPVAQSVGPTLLATILVKLGTDVRPWASAKQGGSAPYDGSSTITVIGPSNPSQGTNPDKGSSGCS